MTPAAFVYRRASSVSEAIKFLVDFGDEAKALAGGHSLLPIMKLRMSTPAVVIDLDSIRGLDYIRREGGDIAIGALARHADLEDSDLLAAGVPLLKRTAASVGDPQIRHRGTLGGSVAHGDPAADLPAALMALGATLVAEGPSGRRSISIDDFYRGFLQTVLAPDELLVEVRVPWVGQRGWSFQKFRRRSLDWAIVGVAHQVFETGAGIGLVNMGQTTVRARAAEKALRDGAAPQAVAALADADTAPATDGTATSAYRRDLARVLLHRALVEAKGAR
ncbi:xanthine dehydrogenase family protein subunit M [Nocardioides sp. AN3]